MGGPMARNILMAGHDVTVLDLRPEAVDTMVAAGAKFAATARELAEGAEFVITMLPDAPDVERAVSGPNGLIAGLRPGSIYIDMSTIDIATTRTVGAKVAQAGAAMIDSPVGKTEEHAIAGTLTLMVGGDDETLRRAEPILRTMGSDLFHCGELGMGQAMKLVNNLLASVLIAASSEALVAGAKAGLTLETMISVLKTTMAWNQQLAVAMHNRALKGNFAPGFMVKLAQKDCRLAMKMNADLGLNAPIGAATLAALGEVVAAGMADRDVGAILKLREDEAGVQVRLPL
jgi:4-hydroxybutyrate dehydrogenase/sulfolactaldehyde 3-reductase